MMKTYRRYLTLLIPALLIGACEPNVTPEESESARQALVDWLECEECEEGQLEATVAHGKLLQPMLRNTLKAGVAPASRELYRRELEKRYDELVEYSQTHPNSAPGMSAEAFVDLYLGNQTAQHQTRSARALFAIAGDDNIEALRESLDGDMRDDVKATVRGLLDGSISND